MIKTLMAQIKQYKKDTILTPIFTALEVLFEVIIPLITAKLIDEGIDAGNMSSVVKYGVIMVIVAFLSLGSGVLAGKYAATASTGFACNLRHAMYDNIQRFSFSNIDKFSTAGLITRMTTDVTNIQNAFQMLIRIAVRAPFTLICSLIMCIAINGELSLIFLAALVFLGVALFLIIGKVSKIFEVVFKKYDDLNASVQENVSAIRVVKAFVREDREKEKFHKASDELAKQGSKAAGLVVTVMPILMLMMNVVIVYIYYKGSLDAANPNVKMDVGQISVLASYIVQVLMNIMMVSMLMLQLTRAKACGDRVVEVLDTEIDIKNPENAFVPENPQGNVEFKNVCFGYNKGDNVLENINFKANAGNIVGIIGSTGCGKSSLVNLIPRLYDVTDGEVLVDGVNVKDYDLTALRDMIGVVLQKNVLFSGTIKENIRWGKKDATDDEIIAACKAAQAHDFIMRQPNGYDTDLSQGGLNLSGGQKQRLCIARAMIKSPKILILDDSTSAVDTATEAKIREAFYNELADTTVIIIAQRISSVKDADEIVVLDDGKIDAVGTHDELMKSCEIYQEIYTTQQKGVLE